MIEIPTTTRLLLLTPSLKALASAAMSFVSNIAFFDTVLGQILMRFNLISPERVSRYRWVRSFVAVCFPWLVGVSFCASRLRSLRQRKKQWADLAFALAEQCIVGLFLLTIWFHSPLLPGALALIDWVFLIGKLSKGYPPGDGDAGGDDEGPDEPPPTGTGDAAERWLRSRVSAAH